MGDDVKFDQVGVVAGLRVEAPFVYGPWFSHRGHFDERFVLIELVERFPDFRAVSALKEKRRMDRNLNPHPTAERADCRHELWFSGQAGVLHHLWDVFVHFVERVGDLVGKRL